MLYESYKTWADNEGFKKPLRASEFYGRLRALGCTDAKVKGMRYLRGIRPLLHDQPARWGHRGGRDASTALGAATAAWLVEARGQERWLVGRPPGFGGLSSSETTR